MNEVLEKSTLQSLDGSSGKGLGFSDIFFMFKIWIPLGTNNSLGLVRRQSGELPNHCGGDALHGSEIYPIGVDTRSALSWRDFSFKKRKERKSHQHLVQKAAGDRYTFSFIVGHMHGTMFLSCSLPTNCKFKAGWILLVLQMILWQCPLRPVFDYLIFFLFLSTTLSFSRIILFDWKMKRLHRCFAENTAVGAASNCHL